VAMFLGCTSPQVEPHPEPLRTVCWLDWTDVHDCNPLVYLMRHGCTLLPQKECNILPQISGEKSVAIHTTMSNRPRKVL
jgi:hypothetical protein